MFVIRKVTMVYVPVEDRIQMRAESGDDQVTIMWLSFRLCREIVRRLTRQLDMSQAKRTPIVQSQLVQQSMHSNAKANIKPTPPVRCADVQGFLLTKMIIQVSDTRVVLKIPLPDGDEGILSLTLEEARQWLEILYQQYKKGEWPLEVWPAWMRSEQAAMFDQSVVPLH
jgi:hypothetical protein